MGPGGNFKDGLHSAQVQRSTPPGLTQIVNLYLLPRGRCWFTNADYPGHLALQIHSASSSLIICKRLSHFIGQHNGQPPQITPAESPEAPTLPAMGHSGA